MKKKLIIIGNKPIEKDISSEIDNFDIIVRINRMNNYGKTGTRTDFLFLDINDDFLRLVEKPYDKFLSASKLILNNDKYSTLNKPMALKLGIFTLDQFKNSIKVSFKDMINKIGTVSGCIPTNFLKSVYYFVDVFSKEYEIWISCVDIDHRDNLLSSGEQWSRYHKNIGDFERKKLLDLIINGNINKLDIII